MTLTEEIAEIIGQKRLGGYSDMEAAEAVVKLIGWRPIETAPDNYECFFWLDWSDDCAWLNSPMGGFAKERLFRGVKRSWPSIYKATHWQPLPEPPARKERDDEN